MERLVAPRAALIRFEVAHGVTAADWQDVFRDAGGLVRDSEAYRLVASLYARLQFSGAGAPVGAAQPPLSESGPASNPQSSRAMASLTSS